MNKMWKVESRNESYSDSELIEMIKSGELTPDDKIKTRDLNDWVKIRDSIYQFYMEEKK